jgi:hypothetical protein
MRHINRPRDAIASEIVRQSHNLGVLREHVACLHAFQYPFPPYKGPASASSGAIQQGVATIPQF